MADAAEQAFTTFLNTKFNDATDALPDDKGTPPAAQSATSPQVPEPAGPSGPSSHSSQAASSTAQAPNTIGRNISKGNTSTSHISRAPTASAAAAASAVPPPAELTVKHVGFLGSLAHALVHLQKSAEGLALLRAAAHIMRSSPSNPFVMYNHTPPDSQVLHAHVLMDLVSSHPCPCHVFFCNRVCRLGTCTAKMSQCMVVSDIARVLDTARLPVSNVLLVVHACSQRSFACAPEYHA